MASFADRVLKLVAEPSYKPRTLKALSKVFKVDPDEYAAFRAEIKGLVKEGKLEVGRDKSLTRVDASGAIVGLFRRSAKGFGFVRPGFTAGASLAVGPAAQGSVAGKVTSINGASFVLGPSIGVALYEAGHALPYLAAGAACLATGAAAWRALSDAGQRCNHRGGAIE